MTELRNEMNALRAEYTEGAYPGDLAAELLPRPLPWRRIAWLSSGFGMGSLAAAAAVVLMIGRLGLPVPTPPKDAPVRVVEVADQHLTQLGLPRLPDLSRIAHAVGLDDYDRVLPERFEQLRKMLAPGKPADASDELHRA